MVLAAGVAAALVLVLVLVLVLLYFVDFDLRRESNLSMINDELVKSMSRWCPLVLVLVLLYFVDFDLNNDKLVKSAASEHYC